MASLLYLYCFSELEGELQTDVGICVTKVSVETIAEVHIETRVVVD